MSTAVRRPPGPGLALLLGLPLPPLMAYGVVALLAPHYRNCLGHVDVNAGWSLTGVLAVGTLAGWVLGYAAVFAVLGLDLPRRGLDTRRVTTAVMVGAVLVVGFLTFVLGGPDAPATECPTAGRGVAPLRP